MTRLFIGGSRWISRLNEDVRRRIDRIVEKGPPVVIGDANGVDRAVQAYLHQKGYREVEVFCAEETPRNNLGGWPIRIDMVRRVLRDLRSGGRVTCVGRGPGARWRRKGITPKRG